jgi:hypothetical protein
MRMKMAINLFECFFPISGCIGERGMYYHVSQKNHIVGKKGHLIAHVDAIGVAPGSTQSPLLK